MQISKSFTAVGSSDQIYIRSGESFTYSVSGTFVGTVLVEKSTNGGQNWETVLSKTAADSGTVLVEDRGGAGATLRLRCSAFTSGTIVTVIANAETGKKRILNAGVIGKAGATAGWVPAGTTDVCRSTLPASKTASTLVIPITGLKIGDIITSFHLIGQIESAGGAVTVDADLRKQTAAAADVSDASVGGITQLAITADTIMSATNTTKSGLSQLVAVDETYYVLITATTAGSTDIDLQGVALTVMEA